MHRSGTLRVAIPLSVAVLAACGDEPPALTVADVSYTRTELLGLTPARRDRLVEITALAVAANRGELVERATVLRSAATRRARISALRTHRILAGAEVGDDVLAAQYELDPEYELEVRHMVVLAERGFSEPIRDEARAKVEAGLERVLGGEDFGMVAGEVSEEPGAAERGGLLQPGRAGTWVDEFWSAASALAPGEVSGVVESPFGFHVLKLDDRRVVPFAEARGRTATRIAGMLPSTAFDALRDSVRASISVTEPVPGWMAGPPDAELASWPGGTLTAAELHDLVRAEPSSAYRTAQGGGPGAVDLVTRAALEFALAEMATGLELAAEEGFVDRALDDWRVAAEGWAASMGLIGSTRADEIGQAALAALGATGQNATVAREALSQERGPLLRSLYPVETGASDGT